MKTYGNFFEDIEQRRAALAQRKKDQMARLKQKTAQDASDMDQLVSSNLLSSSRVASIFAMSSSS